MISFGIKPGAAKRMFFDMPAVINAVGKGTARSLASFGGYVRQVARRLIRPRKAASEPGNPPHSHTGALRDFIYFSYDPTARSVVIGPTVLNQAAFRGPKFSSRQDGLVPETLEHGGIISLFETQLSGGLWTRADFRSRRRIAERPQRWRTVRIAPRPYMQPAFEMGQQEALPEIWTDSVRPAA